MMLRLLERFSKPVAPTRKPIQTLDAPEDNYRTVVNRLGIEMSGVVTRTRTSAVMAELAAMGLPPFDTDEVTAYLTRMYGREQKQYYSPTTPTWCWKLLCEPETREVLAEREQEDTLTRTMRQMRESNFAVFRSETRRNGERVTDRYVKAVPLPVLLTVERLADAVPGLVFYVSDEYTRKPVPDPFLAVWTGERLIVIEQWDEPSFTGKRV